MRERVWWACPAPAHEKNYKKKKRAHVKSGERLSSQRVRVLDQGPPPATPWRPPAPTF